jgi:predicted nucleic acid-binding protein
VSQVRELFSVKRAIVILDACVLIPMPLCDTLLRAAEQYLYTFFTSPTIIEETTRNLSKILAKRLDEAEARQKAQHRIEAMLKAFPESMIEPSPHLIDRLHNDPKDRHILAVAIKAREDRGEASLTFIVTTNLKDFPQDALEPYSIQAISPDNFLCFLLQIYDGNRLLAILQQQADERYQGDLVQLLEKFERDRITRFARSLLNIHLMPEFSRKIDFWVRKVGHKKPNNVKILARKTCQIILEKFQVTVIHKSRGSICEWNHVQVIKSDISCEDYKQLKKFTEEGRIVF